MSVEDPKGRYPLGIIVSPPLAIHDGEGTGFWILDHDGRVYFGQQLPPMEVGFGIMQEEIIAPTALLESAAELIDRMYEAMEVGFECEEDDEAFHRLPEILMEGMGMGDDEAHDHAEAILEEAERLDTCPWKLAALHISGVDWDSSEEPELPAEAEKPEGKLIPFPTHRVRPPADTTKG